MCVLGAKTPEEKLLDEGQTRRNKNGKKTRMNSATQ